MPTPYFHFSFLFPSYLTRLVDTDAMRRATIHDITRRDAPIPPVIRPRTMYTYAFHPHHSLKLSWTVSEDRSKYTRSSLVCTICSLFLFYVFPLSYRSTSICFSRVESGRVDPRDSLLFSSLFISSRLLVVLRYINPSVYGEGFP